MFHVLLPVIAMVPVVVLLLIAGALLLGISLVIAGLVVLVRRLAKESKKKTSLVVGIILLSLGLLIQLPVYLLIAPLAMLAELVAFALGGLLALSGVIALIVRAARKSKKKGSKNAAIALIVIGLVMQAPMVIGLLVTDLRTDEVTEKEVLERLTEEYVTRSLPEIKLDDSPYGGFEFNGKKLVFMRLGEEEESKDVSEMKAVAKISFNRSRMGMDTLYEGELSNGCKYYLVKRRLTFYTFVLEEDAAKVRALYEVSE